MKYLAFLLLPLLFACQENYRYPCQDPENWDTKQCKIGKISHAIAVEKALRALGNARLDPGVAGAATVGLAGTWEGLNLQVNFTV